MWYFCVWTLKISIPMWFLTHTKFAMNFLCLACVKFWESPKIYVFNLEFQMWWAGEWLFLMLTRFHKNKIAGSSRYRENSSSDSEEEILRRLKLQQSISLQSGQISKYGGLSPLNNQSINFDGFQPILSLDNSVPSATKPFRQHSSIRSSSVYNNNNIISSINTQRQQQLHSTGIRNHNRDLLGQAERGKIGSHSSSECSSNSSVEASVESNMGLISHERKGKLSTSRYHAVI